MKMRMSNENENDHEKNIFYIVSNSTNFDIFAVLSPPKTFVCCFITTF